MNENPNKFQKLKHRISHKGELAKAGVILMLVGPLLLVIQSRISATLPELPAMIIMWTTMVLPGIGAVLSIISLIFCHQAGLLSKVLAVVTIVMCNPFFYVVYVFFCVIMGNALAGLPMM